MNEIKFLNNLFPQLKTTKNIIVGPGDDCAALKWRGKQLLLVATDQLIAAQHYTPGKTRAAEAGRKLLARNISDIAAMGGTPLYATVCIASGSTYNISFNEKFYSGILEIADELEIAIIGGDLCGISEGHASSLTILGEVAADKIVLRSGSTPGDFLYSTGTFGNSFPTEHHLNFIPRLKEGQWLAEKGFAKSMIDVSDGLLLDILRICRAGKISVELNTDNIPLRTTGLSIEKILTDGEDYELIFAVSPEHSQILEEDWPFKTKLTKIGSFLKSKEKRHSAFNQKGMELLEMLQSGYSHFL
ncbi:MAG: thiamine-phosphate kinase [Verrucomicrobiota bacterium]|nr:thiamine-phosphate kinase [Verrucomicrobiota bacterium]